MNPSPCYASLYIQLIIVQRQERPMSSNSLTNKAQILRVASLCWVFSAGCPRSSHSSSFPGPDTASHTSFVRHGFGSVLLPTVSLAPTAMPADLTLKKGLFLMKELQLPFLQSKISIYRAFTSHSTLRFY